MKIAILLGTAVLLTVFANPGRVAEGDPALRIRAAFILNFLKFAEWPADVMGKEGDDLVLAVVGKEPIGPVIRETLDGRVAQGRMVRVRAYPNVAALQQETKPFHAVFLMPGIGSAWPELRAEVSKRAVLTVSEYSEFCSTGGMLNLFEQDGRIKFEANPEAAQKAGLRLPAEVLKLATIVKTKGK